MRLLMHSAMEKKRFDTRFFSTVIRARDIEELKADGLETENLDWVSPFEALRRGFKGDMFMIPPQVHTMADLACYPRLAEYLPPDYSYYKHRGEIVPYGPIRVAGGEGFLVYPGDDRYPNTEKKTGATNYSRVQFGGGKNGMLKLLEVGRKGIKNLVDFYATSDEQGNLIWKMGQDARSSL
jgi:hypothetical protein